MKYERRLKDRSLEALIEGVYGNEALEQIRLSDKLPEVAVTIAGRVEKLTEDDFEKNLVFDPDGWNPYPEITPDHIISFGISHWLVQDEEGQMRSMTYCHEYGSANMHGWRLSEFRVTAFRRLPEEFKRERTV